MKDDRMTLKDILRQQRMAREEIDALRRLFGPDAVKMAVLTAPGHQGYRKEMKRG